ncbi:MAG: nucleotidyl transferase AbiEii/AbiGii toxin family protein [Candidatus Hydrogenedentes bacterium]|nr:nucleotidyl transferase AbiEii/AbiGii toxin family protein [Candidatus Hydrogenedentota bacterium]
MTPPPKNMPASIRERLRNLARPDGSDFNLLLAAFATERFLYRLSQSKHAELFVLKGARLFALWSHKPHRPTRDLDLLGFGEPSPEALGKVIRDICRMEVIPDGLIFDEQSIHVEEIRVEHEYNGQRIRLVAHLQNARIPLQIDIGFGDAITPEPQQAEYTALLSSLPAPYIRVYPRETVIAEKLQAMVSLDVLNTRMKDFYDLCVLAREFDFDGPTLCQAIHATFERRKTDLPKEIPACLWETFPKRTDKRDLWAAFLQRAGLPDNRENDFVAVHRELIEFLSLPLFAAAHPGDFNKMWTAGKGWV